MASKRGKTGPKRLDIGEMRQALRDRRVWTGLGVVRQFPGESSHYEELTGEDADLLVDVELMPNGERVLCRTAWTYGAWSIPPVGAEVAVLIPEGDFDADPIIVAVLTAPDGLAALATKADVTAIWEYLMAQFSALTGHTHTSSAPGNQTVGVTTVAAPSPPLGIPNVAPAEPVGTTILKGK